MILAALGVVVIVRPEGAGASRGLLGDLLVFGAMASWVAYTFLARGLIARYPALLVTAATMAVGAATLLPPRGRGGTLHPDARPLGCRLAGGGLPGIALLGRCLLDVESRPARARRERCEQPLERREVAAVENVRSLDSCTVSLNAVVNRDVNADGHEDLWVLIDTKPLIPSHGAAERRTEYAVRTDIEEGHRQPRVFSRNR